ncbi:hypothetical protein AVEN_250338-1 [Araneus ventricosus]|uniref:Uncharacterized protein n=1 Tax=Araneus ventricosus TaxID=182803 RepID=A0A4Y2U9N9_ARAVE|nr:hypothetical protein AVEN_250338-1 [Araneus ventricosus]
MATWRESWRFWRESWQLWRQKESSRKILYCQPVSTGSQKWLELSRDYVASYVMTSLPVEKVQNRALKPRVVSSFFPKNFKILKSSSKRHVTSLSEQLTKNYHIQRYEFSQQQQLLFTGTSSCIAPATIPQDPDGLPPTQPLPPTTAADHLIPRTEIIQHQQRTITGY